MDRTSLPDAPNIVIAAGDVLLIEADFALIDRLRERDVLSATSPSGPSDTDGERIEAVVMPDSLLLGSRIADIWIFAEHGLRVTGLAQLGVTGSREASG